MTEQRDWQKDMETANKLQAWDVDPGGVEDAAAFYTLDEDGIYTTIRADGMLGEDAEMLEESIAALPYWLQQYAAAQEEIARINCDYYADKQRFHDRGRELAAEKERADKLELSLKATEGLTREETKRADGWREHVRKLNIDLEYAEARERKLREALEQAQYHLNSEQYMTAESVVEDALSLYPKEGETT